MCQINLRLECRTIFKQNQENQKCMESDVWEHLEGHPVEFSLSIFTPLSLQQVLIKWIAVETSLVPETSESFCTQLHQEVFIMEKLKKACFSKLPLPWGI